MALANVVLADHGASVEEEPLDPAQPTPGRPYRPRLPRDGVAFVDPAAVRIPLGTDVTTGAGALARPDPRTARAALTLDDGERTWTPQPDLVASGRLDAHVVVEPEPDGGVRLRFGDGVTGRTPGSRTFRARYRLGGGRVGDVAAGRLTHWLPRADGTPAIAGALLTVWNPVSATGGTDPEDAELVRQLAPFAYRHQRRAVTTGDYAVAAESVAGVQRSVDRRRWTGSWYAHEVTVDPLAGQADPTVPVTDLLEIWRMAGVDVEITQPVYVPLLVGLFVCPAPGYVAGDVEAQLQRRPVRPLPARRRDRPVPPGPLHLRPAALRQRRRRHGDGRPRGRLGRRHHLRQAGRSRVGDGRQPRGRRDPGRGPRGAALRHRPEQPRGGPGRDRDRGDGVTTAGPLDPQAAVDATANPPGQPVLHRQTAPHALALARMRERLAAPGHDLALRSLAGAATDEPAVALLDAWAVVADTVSFYSERIANEGFLRTAVQRGSLRELARTLGYELRPGVAAQVDLAFTAETAAGAPEVIIVPAGTPVQSVPGPGELPQTFETAADLEVRPAWNRIAAVDSRPQTIAADDEFVWVRGPVTVRPGDAVLVTFSTASLRARRESPDPRRAAHGHEHGRRRPPGLDPAGPRRAGRPRRRPPRPRSPHTDVEVHAFRARLRLFGWNAPDPNLLVVRGRIPPEPRGRRSTRTTPLVHLDELRRDRHARAWTATTRRSCRRAGWSSPSRTSWPPSSWPPSTPDGKSDFAVSGPVTRVERDGRPGTRRRSPAARSSCTRVSTPLPAADEPGRRPVAGTTLVLPATDPPLPPGRRLLLAGRVRRRARRGRRRDHGRRHDRDRRGRDLHDGRRGDDRHRRGPLPAFRRQGLVVLGNVATATHGESVAQVLGSGDGRTPSRCSARAARR